MKLKVKCMCNQKFLSKAELLGIAIVLSLGFLFARLAETILINA
jgi:hypothetical protein